MMQEAVEQDEVEPRRRQRKRAARIDDREVLCVSPPRVSQITVVAVQADIARVEERMRVRARAAADVEHAPSTPELVVSANGRELLLGIRRLPRAVDGGALQDRPREAHREEALID